MKKLTERELELLDGIITALKERNEFRCQFDEGDPDIKLVRTLGRQAARELGWKVTTYASDPEKRDDRRVNVWVVVTESHPLRDEVIHQREMKKVMTNMNNAVHQLRSR